MVSSMIAAALESGSGDAKSLVAEANKSKTELKESTKKILFQIDEAKESCAWLVFDLWVWQ